MAASVTALAFATALSLAGASAASADEVTPDGAVPAVSTAPAVTPEAPVEPAPVEPAPIESAPVEPAPVDTEPAAAEPVASAEPPATSTQTASRSAASTATKKTYYYVAIYLYQKLDPTKPAAWENSGLQTLLDSTEGTEWFTEFPPYGELPEEVCGTGWGVQQDKVATTDPYFQWPTHVEYPNDTIGWPPLYAAKHQELSELIDVPECDPVEVTPGDPSGSVAQCVDGTVTTGSVTVGGEPGLVYTITGTGAVSHIVIDPVTSPVTSGLPVGTYLVSVTALPGYTLSGPAEWPVAVEITTPVDCVQLPDHAFIPTNATVTPQVCSTTDGSIVLGQVDGVSYFEGVTYYIDGVEAPSWKVARPAGTYVVTVVPDEGNTLDGPATFTLTIPASGAACGELTTLALTGGSPEPWLPAAIILLLAGAIAVAAPRIRARRSADEVS